MKKTETGKGKSFSNYRSSNNLSRVAKKIMKQNAKTNDAQIQIQTLSNKEKDKLSHNRLQRQKPFQYYFYQKSASDRDRLNNSKTTLELLRRKQKLKLKHQKQQLRDGKLKQNQESQDRPFYEKYKKNRFFDEGELNQYGLAKNNPAIQEVKVKDFDKIRQNIKNINKYRKTRGMVSPRKDQSKYSNKKPQNQLQTTARQQQNHQDCYQLGLCPIQYKKTIAGLLKQKSQSYHHLNWSKDKSKKIDNINKIWYSNDRVNQIMNYEFQKMRKSIQQQTKLKKCHSFKSYSGHRLFPRKENELYPCFNQLDKANKLQNKDLKLTAQRFDYNFTDFDNMLVNERPPIPKRLGTHLNYQVDENTLKTKAKYFSQSLSPRKFKFGRQIISPQGHFR